MNPTESLKRTKHYNNSKIFLEMAQKSEMVFKQNVKNRRKHRGLGNNTAELTYVKGALVDAYLQ